MKTPIFAALTAVLLVSAAPHHPFVPLGIVPAVAQSALTFENLSVKGETGAIRIPKLTIEGSTATRAEIEALFDPKQAVTAPERLRRISARLISIPVIELDQILPDGTATTVYRDTTIRNVANGIVGEAVTPLMTMRHVPKAGASNPTNYEATSADYTMKGLDIGLILTAIFTGGGKPDEPMKVAMEDQSVGKTTVRFGTNGSFTMAGATMRGFTMRALPRSMMDLIAEASRNQRDEEPDWEKKNLALMLPLFTGMGIGMAEVMGVSAEFQEPGKTQKTEFAIDRMALSGTTLIPSMMRFQGMRFSGEGTKVTVGDVTFDGLDVSGVVAAATKAAEAQVDPEPMELLPKIGLIRIGGVDIDVADTRNPRERSKLKLGLFETAMGGHIGAIPTAMRMALDKLQFEIPASTRDTGLKSLLDLGYNSFDVSAGYDLSWQEAQKTLTLKDVHLRSEGMFSLKSALTLANVPKDLFTTDQAKAAVAALGVVAKSLDATLVNTGIFEKVIAKQAKDLGRKADDIRAEFAAGATLLVPVLLGDHPAARALGPVLGRFIADPKNLRVSLTSTDGAGIGVTDFMAAKDPMAVLKKVDIKAAANE